MKSFFSKLVSALLIVAILTLPHGVYAQDSQPFHVPAGNMKLLGTSTMHDWTMNGPFQVTGNYQLKEGSRKLESISQLNFALPVTNLKSDKKRLDETAYKALKAEQHKEILFTLVSANVREVDANSYAILAKGNLTIAGVTKPITLNVSWFMHDDNTVTCTGVQKLKMTDYQVQPPGFLGIMKAGDEITLDFNFQFKS